MSQSIVKKDTCYSCEQEGNDLVNACKTSNCDTKFHIECLEERIKSNKKSCPECEFPIVVTEFTTFNWGKCCKLYFYLIFTFLMIVGGTYFNIKSALGNTPLSPFLWDNRGCVSWKEGTNPYKCDGPVPIVIMLSFLLSLMFWQFPQLVCRDSKTNKKGVCCRYNILCCTNNKTFSCLTMIIMFCLSNLIITITHFVGQCALNDHSNLTHVTFVYGLITYIWIILYLVIITISVLIPYTIANYTIETFTTKKLIVGVKKLESLPNKSKVV